MFYFMKKWYSSNKQWKIVKPLLLLKQSYIHSFVNFFAWKLIVDNNTTPIRRNYVVNDSFELHWVDFQGISKHLKFLPYLHRIDDVLVRQLTSKNNTRVKRRYVCVWKGYQYIITTKIPLCVTTFNLRQ